MAQAQANTTPLALNHTGLFPSVTVSFNLAPGVSLSDATLAIDEMQQKMNMPSIYTCLHRRMIFLHIFYSRPGR